MFVVFLAKYFSKEVTVWYTNITKRATVIIRLARAKEQHLKCVL